MSITDPIADFLVALKSSSVTNKAEVVTPFSNLKFDILKVLKKEGFVEDYIVKSEGKKNNIVVKLKYFDKEPAIKDAKKVTKISKRVYMQRGEVPLSERNRIWVISTSQGIMTTDESKEKGLGGEVLCYVE